MYLIERFNKHRTYFLLKNKFFDEKVVDLKLISFKFLSPEK